MALIDEVYNSIEHYFEYLSKTGYMPYGRVFQLLVFSFIQEVLYSDMRYFVTEQDYKLIDRVLQCIYGSCLIPFPDYKRGVDQITDRLPDEFRITEEGVLRDTELFDLRVKS